MYLEPEADEAHSGGTDELEAGVLEDEPLELLGEGDVLADVLLQPLDAVDAQHEPQLEGPEATAQRNLPVLQKKRRI